MVQMMMKIIVTFFRPAIAAAIVAILIVIAMDYPEIAAQVCEGIQNGNI